MSEKKKRILVKDLKDNPDMVSEIISNISETLKLFSKKIAVNIAETTEIMSKALISGLQLLYEETPEISAEKRAELEKWCEVFLDYGWVVFDFMPIGFYSETIGSKEDADKLVLKHCNEDNMQQVFDTFRTIMPNEDAANIEMCFENGAYKACAAMIVPLIEHYVVTEYKVSKNSILKQPAILKMKELNTEISSNKVQIYYYLHNYSLYIAMSRLFDNVILSEVDDSGFSIPNRHCLLHGYSKRTYTKNDCLCLLFILFGLIEQKDMLISAKK